MDKEFDQINQVAAQLYPKLKEYIESCGVEINEEGFLSCLHPNHPDKNPSCSIGGKHNEQVFHCFSCLPPDEELYTSNGLKQIQEVEPGDVVLCEEGHGRITQVIKKKPSSEIHSIYLENLFNDSIKLTGDHKVFYVKNMKDKVPYLHKSSDREGVKFNSSLKGLKLSKKYKDKIVVSVGETSKLTADDYVVFPVHDSIKNKLTTSELSEVFTFIDKDLLWLIGLYCAEGSTYRGGITFTLHRNEKEYQERIERILRKQGYNTSIYEYDYKPNTTNVSCSSTVLQKWFEKYIGKYSHEKHMFEGLFSLSIRLQKAWLDGLNDGDGSIATNRITITSKQLIATARRVAINNMIPFSIGYNPSYIGNDGIQRKETWWISLLNKENQRCFYDISSDGVTYCFMKIKQVSLRLYKQPEYVYDITVDSVRQSHTFFTKQMMVHNCGQAGNIFHAAHYLENKPITGVGFYEETLPYLCGKYNIPYEPIQISNEARDKYQKRSGVRDAITICHANAFKGTDLNKNHPAIKHLLDRGITEKSIKKFKIGCIEGTYTDYVNKMISMGYTDKAWLQRADLANKGIFNPKGIIIPILDHKSRPVGFVTRRTDMKANDKGQSKYVNSINSDIYHKSELLFNFNTYDPVNGPLWIVEGYLDAVYLDQCGIKNVCALGSTSLTEQHVDLLMREGIKNIILCFDGDTGGQQATKLAIERTTAYNSFKSIRIAELPEGEDPDSFVRKNGVEEFRKLASQEVAISPFAWMIKHTTFQDDPIVVVEQAIPTIASEESNIKRLHMIRELSKITGIAQDDIKKDVEAIVNKDSSVFLEELTDINKYLQIALSRKKVKDTKNIINESLIKIQNLEKKYNNRIDSRVAYDEKLNALWEKIEGGSYKYGLATPKFQKLADMFDGLPYTTCMTLVGGRPGAGKCLSPYELVWMYDGSLKRAKDVKYGDLLMGDDSTPRRVLGTTSGEDYMYDVIQANGITYRVNEPHVLSLKRSRNGITVKHGDIIDIPLNKFVKKSDKFKNNFKGYKVPIKFKAQDLLIDPYFLGLWLGDGDTNSSKVYTIDNEIVGYIYEYANTLSLQVTENKNGTCPSYAITKGKCFNNRNFSLQQLLRVEGILGNKHIPEKYIINSRENRLELLAGLIDSDGWYCKDKGYFEVTQKNESLARSIKKVADTLGFRTNLSKKKTQCKKSKYQGEAYRLLISGNVWDIPTKVRRKIAPHNAVKKDWTMSQIEIRSVGRGEYAGFQLDGNGRFLLSDGTVTHNTTWMNDVAVNVVEENDDAAVFFMSIDDTTELMSLKMLAQKTGYSTSDIKKYHMLSVDDRKKIRAGKEWLDNLRERFIMVDATEGVTPEVMEAHIEWFMKEFPEKKKIFFLDNFHKLRVPVGKSKSDAISQLSERIKDMTRLYNLHIMMTVELRKMSENSSRPTVSDLKDSVQLEYDADAILLVHNDKQVKDETNIVWYGPYGDEGEKPMPYIEISNKKNKMTGKTGRLAYKLNTYNLQIEEDSYSTVLNLHKKNAASQAITSGRSKII